MFSKTLYFRWDEFRHRYMPTCMLPEEHDIRLTPKQGRGTCEIAAWLSVEFSLHSINEMINALRDLSSSRVPNGNFGLGNGNWTLVTGEYVFICSEYIRPRPVLMTTEQALYILEQYKSFLERNHKKRHPPEPIDVEFIAEGQEAIDMYNALDGTHGSPFDTDEPIMD